MSLTFLFAPRSQVIRMVGESQETVGAGVGGGAAGGSNKLPTLSEYGTNLTQQAAEVCGFRSLLLHAMLSSCYAWWLSDCTLGAAHVA